MNEQKAIISQIIRNESKRQHISISAIAKNLGVTRNVVYRVLDGTNFKIDVLLRILEQLNLELTVQPRKGKNHE